MDSITTSDLRDYKDWLDDSREQPLAASTINKHFVVIEKILKDAYERRMIDNIPLIPREKQKDTPRPWFDTKEYNLLWRRSKKLAKENITVRGIPLTEELFDFIIFMTNTFLRPTVNEVFSLKHKHVQIGKSDDGADGLIIDVL